MSENHTARPCTVLFPDPNTPHPPVSVIGSGVKSQSAKGGRGRGGIPSLPGMFLFAFSSMDTDRIHLKMFPGPFERIRRGLPLTPGLGGRRGALGGLERDEMDVCRSRYPSNDSRDGNRSRASERDGITVVPST